MKSTKTTTATMAKTTDTNAPRRSHALTVAYATGAIFVIAMALLVYRLEAGLDPSIGTAAIKSPAVKQQRLVVHKRIVKVIRDEPVAVAAGAGSAGTAAQGGYSAPAQTGGSGGNAAPAQPSTPAPAPAPAPAPVTKAS